jgi:hypothetical protein
MEEMMRIQVEVTNAELDRLVGYAIIHGFVRVEPRKRWTDRERREAARYAMEKLIGTL